jgi:hypothetical protein
MRKLAFLVFVLQVFVLSAAAQPQTGASALQCGVCVGVTGSDGADVPVLARVAESDLAAFAPAQPSSLTVIVSYTIDTATDPLLDIEQHTRTIIDWAKARGPFDGLGISVTGGDAALAAFAVKRLAVTAQGLDVAKRIVGEANAEALSYLDAVLTRDVEQTAAWLAERDPSKKIYAVVDVTSPNALFDLAAALAKGATRAYASVGGAAAVPPGPSTSLAMTSGLAAFNRTMTSDWAYDSTAKTTVLDAKGNRVEMPVLTFVRGEDLRTLLIPRGETGTASILSLPGDRYTRPRRIDAAGERDVTDTGRRGGQLLVGTPAPAQPYALVVDYTEKPDRNAVKETIDIATERGITVEEIIRNHQAYDAFQESIQPRYIARNTTKLRFEIGGGAEALEAAIQGDYFSDPEGRADWVWSDFFINGVKWKYGRIPELPLIQPEKVTQLPLDLHLTNEYRYELVRPADMLGFRTYEVRFAPPPNAPENLPLYRGTVWIDAKTWARVRIAMVQLNLTGEVLSNEERVDFAAFSRDTKQPLTAAQAASADPKSLYWLPYEVAAQQVISAAGRASVVQRATTFENFRVEPAEYETLLAQASASDARMVRETEAGLRYLEKTGDGERVVKEGFDTAQLFMVGGVHHDKGRDYPVIPLGGVDYFNFDLFGKGIQANVFFAGLVIAANATDPSVAGTRMNLGVDFFGIAVPFTNTMHRNGEERLDENVKALPMGLTLRAGRPFLQFGKVDVNLGISHLTYQRAEDTAAGFVVPSDTFIFSPSINAQYSRRGYTVSGFYDFNRRSEWEPWGNLAEYDPDQKSFVRFGGSIGKSFFLPKFQRIGIDLNYLGGRRLDRFSKYELGFFGAQRVHGIESGSVRAERAILGHLSYGFVFSQQFRLEAFYDHALIDDAVAGYEGEPFQGVGIAGQTVGPYGTLLRLDIGKSIGRHAQDGFVANVVFLKLF